MTKQKKKTCKRRFRVLYLEIPIAVRDQFRKLCKDHGTTMTYKVLEYMKDCISRKKV